MQMSGLNLNMTIKPKLLMNFLEQLPDQEISFPVENNGYLYYEKLNKDEQLPRFYRKAKSTR